MPNFIDLFAGCGGLSLGLSRSGWTGIFAIERHPDAFATLAKNLIESPNCAFQWPNWLDKRAWDIDDFLEEHSGKLAQLRGRVDLIAGGPPCQGYSTAGRRNPNDHRNSMVDRYLEIVDLIKPSYLLLENVRGFTSAFKSSAGKRAGVAPSEQLIANLQLRGFNVSSALLNCSDWGVPQRRMRFIAVAVHERMLLSDRPVDFIARLKEMRPAFLRKRGLNPERPVSAKEAMADLSLAGRELVPDSEFPKYHQLRYESLSNLSPYAKLMRRGAKGGPNSMRLPRHSLQIVERFSRIQVLSKKGRALSPQDRELHGLRKRSFTPLSPDEPSATVTTLPDDMLHYSEPRIMTVRELARLQSFPDSFEFLGKYTTGGAARKGDCPRYTQVGNAVPPLLAEALGDSLIHVSRSLNRATIKRDNES